MSDEDCEKPVDENHLRNVMLYYFHAGKNATETANIICETYPGSVKVRKVQYWFSRFRNDNFDLTDGERSGRPRNLDEDLLKAEIEADPTQTLKMLSGKFDRPLPKIQEYLSKLGFVRKNRSWILKKKYQTRALDEE